MRGYPTIKNLPTAAIAGFPNVGKSSLLNELTRAQSKVANYPFTTLEPNLGVFYELVLADIPGLIEGASGGKGLGMKFLRHIERTNTLFHLISAESDDPAGDYRIVRKELGQYAKALLEKREYVLLSKSDLATPAAVKKKAAALKKLNPSVTAFSIHDSDSVERVNRQLHKLIKEKQGA